MAEAGIDRYAELHAGFRWQVPEHFNIAEVCCSRWARETPDAIAIRYAARGRLAPRLHLRASSTARPTACPTRCARSACARRPRRDRHAAALRDGDRAHGDLPDGRDRGAAVDAVRPRGARVPPQRQRRAGRDRRRDRHRQRARGARRSARRCATLVAVGGAEGRGDARLDARCSPRARAAFDAGRHARRRCRPC